MKVSINGDPPKWMVYFMENPIIEVDDLGVPLVQETPISWILYAQTIYDVSMVYRISHTKLSSKNALWKAPP